MESCEFFIYFGDQILVQCIIGKHIFPYAWLPFHFANVFFSHIEAFWLDVAPFLYPFFYIPCSRRHTGENTAVWNIWNFPAMFSSRTFMVLQLTFEVFYPSWVYFYVLFKLVVKFHFFACSCPDLPTPFVEESIFTLFYASCPLGQISIDHRDMGLFLGSQFCSIDLYFCVYASTILFWLLWPYNTVWYQVAYLQLYSPFSRLLMTQRFYFYEYIQRNSKH